MSNTVVTNNTTLESIIIQDTCSVDIKEIETTDILEVTSDNTLDILVVPTPTYEVSITDASIDVVLQEQPSVILTNTAGPQGPAGAAEEEMVYSKRVDFVGDTIIYKGEAQVGTSESSSLWRLRKLIIEPDDDVSEIWADGTASFIFTWDERASKGYS